MIQVMDAEHQKIMENHPDIMRPMHEKPNYFFQLKHYQNTGENIS